MDTSIHKGIDHQMYTKRHLPRNLDHCRGGASLDSTHSHTDFLIRLLPSHKQVIAVPLSQAQQGQISNNTRQESNHSSEGQREKRKVYTKVYYHKLKQAKAHVHYHAIDLTCMT